MHPDTLYGVTAVVCFSLPVLAILYFRLYRHAGLIALMVYYSLMVLRCLCSYRLPPEPSFENEAELLFSYIEIPLMLAALLFFCPAKQHQQRIHGLILFFIVYETLVAALHGFTPYASLYITTLGLFVIVLYALFLFLRQLRFTVLHGKNWGRVLMLGALLFSNSCYLIMFCAHLGLKMQDVSSIYALHFLSSGIGAVIMSLGLYMMRHRIKELQELKVTRRELQMVFGA